DVGVAVAGDHRALILERRADRARWLGVVPPLVIGTPDPTAIDDLVAKQGRFASLGLDTGAPGVVQGMGASRGVARGRARVGRGVAGADRLAPGEVLVCRTTSPAWTPLIARAAAVVADAGGVLAHCAIVAREHAIPCVVGAGVATERIADGMLVTVDGARGVVHIDRADVGGPETRAPAPRPSVCPGRVSSPSRGASQKADGVPIVWLGDPACHDASLVGGKAANLSRLAARHPVPPGFCLTAAVGESLEAHERPLPTTLRAKV